MNRHVIFSVSALIAGIMAFSSCTIKQVPDEKRTVTVCGCGEVSVKCDTITVVMSVETQDRDIVKATTDNSTKMQNVIESIKTAGIPADNITTANYTIHQEIQNAGTRYPSTIYHVSNEITVTLQDLEKAGLIIDTAVKAGANNLNYIKYSTSSVDNAVKQARILAVKQAESIATTLATSSGSTLGKVLTISDYTAQEYPRGNDSSMPKAVSMSLMEAATPVSSEAYTIVRVSVNATYELE